MYLGSVAMSFGRVEQTDFLFCSGAPCQFCYDICATGHVVLNSSMIWIQRKAGKKTGPLGGCSADCSQNPKKRHRAGPFVPSLQKSSMVAFELKLICGCLVFRVQVQWTV